MSGSECGRFGVLLVLAGTILLRASAANPPDGTPHSTEVGIRRTHNGVVVDWRPPQAPGGAGTGFEYRVQRSPDLMQWQNWGEKIRRPAGVTEGGSLSDANTSASGFYRLIQRDIRSFTASGGAEVLGFGGTFADELAAVENLTLDAFAQRYPPEPYLPSITFDPSEARYWKEYAEREPVSGGGVHPFSFALTDPENERMRRNGFVVTERLGAGDFAEIYYRVFIRDLPVFITTDSILHAWHRSFDALLADLERGFLNVALADLLKDLREGPLETAWARYGSGVLRESLLDADYFLAVAESLRVGQAVPSKFGQDGRVSATLKAIQQRQYEVFEIFDNSDYVDFSQYTPRGHYPRYGLERYFQAMMWCGQVDLRVAGNPGWASLRQLGTAIVLHDLWRQSKAVTVWKEMNRVLDLLVGPADSLNLEQLGALLRAQGLEDPSTITSATQLETLRAALESGNLGVQHIQGHAYLGGVGGQALLPRSFALFGQRFTFDAWAMGQVTFDRIARPGITPPEQVRRRRSYGLDVAFGVFANDQAVPDLVANMTRSDGVRFRDGFPYQHNLQAVRATIDSLPSNAWTSSVYGHWLSALRALSLPTTGPEYPQAMRTRAWAMKTLNTQLASWTQLKHDTVLYAKPLNIPPSLCFYPAGFVEPRPEFFARMREMAEGTRTFVKTLNLGAAGITTVAPYGTAEHMASQLDVFLGRFASLSGQLEGMARKELAQEPFSIEEAALIDNWIEVRRDYYGFRSYSGHYPSLFLRGNEGNLPPPFDPSTPQVPPTHECAQPDELVTDVLTAGPSDQDGDPGAILHQGVGLVHCLLIAVDNGPDRMTYAGPVFSHYEFETPIGERWTDEAWKQRIAEGKAPPPPPWTDEFLAR